MLSKSYIRRSMRQKLKNYCKKNIFTLGASKFFATRKILKNFKNIFQNLKQTPKVVAIYFPKNYEVNCLTIAKWLQNNYFVSLALPVIESNTKKLKFCKWKIGEPLVKKPPFFVKEPLQSEQVYPEFFIVPLIAFDYSKKRLGQGGGYYDYTLNNIDSGLLNPQKNSITKVGVAYSWQQLPDVGATDWDITLDHIITDKDIL